jgi:hypothetical protein
METVEIKATTYKTRNMAAMLIAFNIPLQIASLSASNAELLIVMVLPLRGEGVMAAWGLD